MPKGIKQQLQHLENQIPIRFQTRLKPLQQVVTIGIPFVLLRVFIWGDYNITIHYNRYSSTEGITTNSLFPPCETPDHVPAVQVL